MAGNAADAPGRGEIRCISDKAEFTGEDLQDVYHQPAARRLSGPFQPFSSAFKAENRQFQTLSRFRFWTSVFPPQQHLELNCVLFPH